MFKSSLLIIFALFGMLSARPNWIDTTTRADSLLTTFGEGAISTWALNAHTTPDTLKDTTIGGQTYLKAISTNSAVVRFTKTLSTPINLSTATHFNLQIQVEPGQDLVRTLGVYFSSSGDFSQYCYISKTPTEGTNYNYKSSTGVYNFTFGKDKWQFYSASFNWATVNRIRIVYQSKSGRTDWAVFKRLSASTSTLSLGECIFTFDDIYKSVPDTAIPIMQKYGINACGFLITTWVDKWYSATRAQLQSMQDGGFDLHSHGVTHADFWTLSKDSTLKEVKNAEIALDTLISNRPRNNRHLFAYPKGRHTDSTDIWIKPFVGFARLFEGNYLSSSIPSGVYPDVHSESPSIAAFDSTTTLATAKGYVDSLIKYKTTSIFVFHSISSNNFFTTSYWSKAFFDSLCAYVAAKRDAGQLINPKLKQRLVYAPDSCIISKTATSTATSYTLTDSIASFTDSIKVYLYDSIAGGTKTLRDSSAMVVGGPSVSFLRSGLTSSTVHTYWLYGRTNSGKWDSTFHKRNVLTRSDKIDKKRLSFKFGFGF